MFTTAEFESIAHHLGVAADRYIQDAKECREVGGGHERLAEQFDRQKEECLAFIRRINDAA